MNFYSQNNNPNNNQNVTIEDILHPLQPNYVFYQRILSEIKMVMKEYRFGLSIDSSVNNTRYATLQGWIGIFYRQEMFRVTIKIFFPYDYPYKSPYVFLHPREDMELVPNHPFIRNDYLIVHSSLLNWGQYSNVLNVLDNLKTDLSNFPPLRLKSRDKNRNEFGNEMKRNQMMYPQHPFSNNERNDERKLYPNMNNFNDNCNESKSLYPNVFNQNSNNNNNNYNYNNKPLPNPPPHQSRNRPLPQIPNSNNSFYNSSNYHSSPMISSSDMIHVRERNIQGVHPNYVRSSPLSNRMENNLVPPPNQNRNFLPSFENRMVHSNFEGFAPFKPSNDHSNNSNLPSKIDTDLKTYVLNSTNNSGKFNSPQQSNSNSQSNSTTQSTYQF